MNQVHRLGDVPGDWLRVVVLLARSLTRILVRCDTASFGVCCGVVLTSSPVGSEIAIWSFSNYIFVLYIFISKLP